MRTALTLLSFAVLVNAAQAQKFSIIPQVGFENSKTNVRFNDLSGFSPAGVVFSPQAVLHLTYKSKPGHGAFLGAASSRTIVPFQFTDPENGMNNYKTTSGDMQWRFEGGYQFSSKPIYFKKPGNKTTKPTVNNLAQKKTCGSYSYRSSCSKNKMTEARPASTDKQKQIISKSKKGSWVRLQPSAGLGYIPSVKKDIIQKSQGGQTHYEYRAGNWNTALITGMAFEFGKNENRLFNVSINYFKGLGHLDNQSISTTTGTKTYTTHLNSDVSGWNMRIGVPFTLGAKKPVVKPQNDQKIQSPKTSCGQYRMMYRWNKTN